MLLNSQRLRTIWIFLHKQCSLDGRFTFCRSTACGYVHLWFHIIGNIILNSRIVVFSRNLKMLFSRSAIYGKTLICNITLYLHVSWRNITDVRIIIINIKIIHRPSINRHIWNLMHLLVHLMPQRFSKWLV